MLGELTDVGRQVRACFQGRVLFLDGTPQSTHDFGSALRKLYIERFVEGVFLGVCLMFPQTWAFT